MERRCQLRLSLPALSIRGAQDHARFLAHQPCHLLPVLPQHMFLSLHTSPLPFSMPVPMPGQTSVPAPRVHSLSSLLPTSTVPCTRTPHLQSPGPLPLTQSPTPPCRSHSIPLLIITPWANSSTPALPWLFSSSSGCLLDHNQGLSWFLPPQ